MDKLLDEACSFYAGYKCISFYNFGANLISLFRQGGSSSNLLNSRLTAGPQGVLSETLAISA